MIPLEVFRRVFRRLGDYFEPTGNVVSLLIDGENTFREIFKAISEAESYIFVQYYVLRSDRLGLELKKLLVQKAEEGISVYLLYDDMGSFWISKDYIRDLKKSGVRVAKFLPVTSFSRLFQMNFRNHRKLVVIDGYKAFTGGLNVGEEYVGKAESRDRYWRDTHVEVLGEAAIQLEEVFLEDWYFSTREVIELGFFERNQEARHVSLKSLPGSHAGIVSVIPTGPTDEGDHGLYLFMQIIQAARSRLWLATPYFVPDQTLLNEFELAVLRGVDLQILLPGCPDHRFVQWVSEHYAEKLQSFGAKIFHYNKGYMHQKIAIIDENLVAMGTINFDNRAIFLNFETTLLISSESLNRECSNVFSSDLTDSTEYVQEPNRFLNVGKKVRAGVARLVEPLL